MVGKGSKATHKSLDFRILGESEEVSAEVADLRDKKRKFQEPVQFNGKKEEVPNVEFGAAMPLKKRPRMYQLAYPIGHGINTAALPIMPFTFEEEFNIADYTVRIEEYQNIRFNFLLRHFKHYTDLLVTHVKCTKEGRKIPYCKEIEKSLFILGLEFTKKHSSNIFKEMESLSSNVRRNVLNSTYPALYVVFFSILEGNAGEKTWMEQQKKTLQITDQNHAAIIDKLAALTDVRSIFLKVNIFSI